MRGSTAVSDTVVLLSRTCHELRVGHAMDEDEAQLDLNDADHACRCQNNSADQNGDLNCESNVDSLPLIKAAGGATLPTQAAAADLSNSPTESKGQQIPPPIMCLFSSPLIRCAYVLQKACIAPQLDVLHATCFML